MNRNDRQRTIAAKPTPDYCRPGFDTGISRGTTLPPKRAYARSFRGVGFGHSHETFETKNHLPPRYHHKVCQGETLADIAKAFGIKMADIRKVNEILETQAMREGMQLVIPVPLVSHLSDRVIRR